MTTTPHPSGRSLADPTADDGGPALTPTSHRSARPARQGTVCARHWRDETGAQTAEYGIVTLAAVGFAGLLAVILSGGDVQGMLTSMVSRALSLD